MRVINEIKEKTSNTGYLAVTLGNFDGVHLGHRELIGELVSQARSHNGSSLVFSFSPHPRAVLAPDKKTPPKLNTRTEQIERLEETGVDYLLYFPFTKELARLSAWEFTESILYRELGVKEIILGPGFRFGFQRQGNTTLLQLWGEELGFEVKVIEPVWLHGEAISSSRIRQQLLLGEVETAAQLLGYHYTVSGTVIPGAARGRGMGFPTINLELPEKLIPNSGVYITKAFINNQWFFGVSNLGVRPTFKENTLTLETHFLDYYETSPPANLTLHFLKRLRCETTFDSVESLKAQIRGDILEARKFISF